MRWTNGLREPVRLIPSSTRMDGSADTTLTAKDFCGRLREATCFNPQGRRVLVLGAGGAARGVVLALIQEGVGHLTIANRTLSRAQRLATLAQDSGVSTASLSLGDERMTSESGAAELIINCTIMGMAHGPAKKASPLSREQIPRTSLVNDLVYNPLETPLLREAAAAGAVTLGGIHMLVYQGAASFEMWTGEKAPVEVMLEAATRAMRA